MMCPLLVLVAASKSKPPAMIFRLVSILGEKGCHLPVPLAVLDKEPQAWVRVLHGTSLLKP